MPDTVVNKWNSFRKLLAVLAGSFLLLSAHAGAPPISILELVKSGTPEEVQKAIQAGADVNARAPENGFTPLMLAAESNPDPQVIGLLLENGAILDAVATGQPKDTPAAIDLALANPNAEVFFTLIKAGAKFQTKIFYGEPSYFAAAGNKDAIKIFNYLAQNGVDLKLCDRNGQTLFMVVAEKTVDPSLIPFLQKAGLDVNAQTPNGGTALAWAASSNPNLEIITALLKAGAKIDSKNQRFAPFIMSAANPNEQIMDFFLEIGEKPTAEDLQHALLVAGTNPNLKLIEKLVGLGADISQGLPPRFTNLLLYAVGFNPNPEVIQYLIDAGCDVNGKLDNNQSVLAISLENPNPEIFQLLLEAGAEFRPDMVDEKGNTFLHLILTRHNSSSETIEFLLQKGADVNARNEKGNTVLWSAARIVKNPEIIRLLLKARAELNAKGIYGDTPLMEAALNQSPEFLSALLVAGADINMQNNYGETALMRAVANPNPNFTKLLLEAGADVNMKDNLTQSSALLRACGYAPVETIQLLLDAGADPGIRNVLNQSAYDQALHNPNLAGTELLETLKKLSPPPLPERKPDLKDFDYVEPYTPPPPREPSDFDSMDWAVRWAAYGKVISLIIGILCLAIVIFLKVRAAVVKHKATMTSAHAMKKN